MEVESSKNKKPLSVHTKVGGEYMQLGLQIGFSFLVFIGLGFWLDGLWGTKPLFLLMGAAFAMVSMMALLYKVWREMEDDAVKKRKQKNEKK